MHKSELRVNPTFLNHVIMYLSSKWAPLEPIGVLAPSESNYEVDSTSHHRESTAL